MNLCLAVDFTVTLMRLTEFGYVESGDRIYRYYFRTPADWENDLQTKSFEIARQMYADLGEKFRLGEPNDPNYIAVKSTNAMILSPPDISEKPWDKTEFPVWEASPCVIVNEEGDYRQIDTQMFGMFFL